MRRGLDLLGKLVEHLALIHCPRRGTLDDAQRFALITNAIEEGGEIEGGWEKVWVEVQCLLEQIQCFVSSLVSAREEILIPRRFLIREQRNPKRGRGGDLARRRPMLL